MPSRAAKILLTVMSGGVSDTTAPTCTIGASDADPTIVSPITITFTWSEDVTGFAAGDVTIGNGTGVTFSMVDASHYTYTVVPNAGATVTIDVAADVCQDAAANNNTAATQYTVASKVLLWDDYTDTTAAGSVNGSAPTPGPGGNRVVTDSNSKLSVGTSVANFATGGVGAGDPGMWYSAITRGAGAVVAAKATPGATTRLHIGLDSNQTGAATEGMRFFSGETDAVLNGAGARLGFLWANGTLYSIAMVLRATGLYLFVKSGTGNWQLWLYGNTGTTATLYPALSVFSATTTINTVDLLRAFKAGTWLPTPLCYDTFTRSNGDLGNSETTGPDAQTGVSARAWTAALGTWAIATNKAACSALDGTENVGIATAAATNDDVVVAAGVTVTTGISGIVLRYVDVDNYLYAYVNTGTNKVALISRAAGIESAVVAEGNGTYTAGGIIEVVLSGAVGALYYRDAYIGQGAVPASAAAVHGLYTQTANATFDDFVILAQGTDAEYGGLDSYTVNF